jgi:predicted small metal-binding protein
MNLFCSILALLIGFSPDDKSKQNLSSPGNGCTSQVRRENFADARAFYGGDMIGTIQERFWAKVDKVSGIPPSHNPSVGKCWIWTATLHHTIRPPEHRYGKFIMNKKRVLAHRVAWLTTDGEIPEDMCVLHKCDNPRCVRPDHLFLGTMKDNSDDMIKKGRRVNHVGSQHGMAILNEDQVRRIKALIPKMSGCKIAKMFNMTKHTIYNIKHGKQWKHVV